MHSGESTEKLQLLDLTDEVLAGMDAFLLGHPEHRPRMLLEKGLQGQAHSSVSKDGMSSALSSCSY